MTNKKVYCVFVAWYGDHPSEAQLSIICDSKEKAEDYINKSLIRHPLMKKEAYDIREYSLNKTID